jgi:hypothetical protein
MLWEGGAFFETPPPLFTKDGMFKPLPPTGARTLASRTAFYYGYTLDSPGMIMRIPEVGSQYLMGFLDADGNPFDGAKTYKVTLPKDIPARAFWSFTLYDNQTRSMLQTPQKISSGRQPELPVAGSRGGGRRLHDRLLRARTAGRRCRWQLDSDRSRKGMVHDPAPLQPATALLRQELAAERGRTRQLTNKPA